MNLGQIDTALLAYLGTASTDKALTPTRRTRWINDALNELRADLPPGYAYIAGTWAPDGGTGRVYSLANLSPAATSLLKVIEVRLESTTGPRLREVRYEQLQAWAGFTFAVTGADEAAVLHTGLGVDESATLYVVTETWPAELADSTDEPSWLPARFHDIVALMAAEVAFASGDEGTMPIKLQEKLLDRRAQLQAHVTRRSADVAKVREPETLVG